MNVYYINSNILFSWSPFSFLVLVHEPLRVFWLLQCQTLPLCTVWNMLQLFGLLIFLSQSIFDQISWELGELVMSHIVRASSSFFFYFFLVHDDRWKLHSCWPHKKLGIDMFPTKISLEKYTPCASNLILNYIIVVISITSAKKWPNLGWKNS